MKNEWSNIAQRIAYVIDWYAIERVLIEEYEKGESKYIEAGGYVPMTENEYYERKGRMMGYGDVLRVLKIDLNGEAVRENMEDFKRNLIPTE